jgi:hypothetical protein
MSDIEFVQGLIFKEPRASAPDYVKGSLSIKREELIAWLQQQSGEWINADVKESKGGKIYIAVNDWKPEGQRQDAPKGGGHGRPAPDPTDFDEDPLPFITNRGAF